MNNETKKPPTRVALRSAMPLRTSSNAAGMHEEQQLGFEKGLGFERQKVDVIVLNRLEALAFIYIGRGRPLLSRFT